MTEFFYLAAKIALNCITHCLTWFMKIALLLLWGCRRLSVAELCHGDRCHWLKSCAEQQTWDSDFPRIFPALLTAKESANICIKNKNVMSSSPLVGAEANSITGRTKTTPILYFIEKHSK